MVHVRDLASTTRRYARGCILAYLDGHRDLHWVLQCVRSSGVPATEVLKITETLRAYNSGPRWEELCKTLASVEGVGASSQKRARLG